MKSVQELRNEGYKVKVSHVRHLKTPVYNPLIGDLDSFLTKGEFSRLSEFDDVFKNRGLKFGDVVDCKGGFTEVRITPPNSPHTYIGKYNFSKTKPFNRKIGLQAALGRALS